MSSIKYLNLYNPSAFLLNRINVYSNNKTKYDFSTDVSEFKSALTMLNLNIIEIETIDVDTTTTKYFLYRFQSNIKIKLNLTEAVNVLRLECDLLTFLEHLKFTIKRNHSLYLYEVKLKENFKNEAVGFQRLNRLIKRTAVSSQITRPTDEQHFINIVADNPSLFSFFTVFMKNEDQKVTGDFMERPFQKSTSMESLYRSIKRHKRMLSGCWVIGSDNYRCLLETFSCNSDINKPFKCDLDFKKKI
jgi:hypothetical protein